MEKTRSEKDMTVPRDDEHETATTIYVQEGLYIDPAVERKLIRKIDCFLIPGLGLLYLVAFLDRGNIGNANIAGMPEDLGLVGNQYGTAVSVLYATYCTFEPVFAIAFKKLSPRWTFGSLVLCWGAITLGNAFVQNYAGLLASRLLLGLTEAGFFPCINMYITMSFKPEEQAVRFSWIYLCSALSGAFGGLLAYGLVQMDGIAGFEGWRWLYAIEGAITFCLFPVAYWWLPNSLEEAWFLTAEEKRLCAIRAKLNHHYRAEERFQWSEVKRASIDWKTWLHAFIQLSHNLTLYGFSTFLPAIVRGLGYSSVQAQLMTVPVYVWAAISFIISAQISDRVNLRGCFVIAANIFIGVGFFILIFVAPTGVRYFGTFVIAMGVYPSTAFNLIWNNANSAGYYKRATSSGALQMIGNIAGAIVGQIYSAQQAPRYITGMAITLGGNGLAISGAIVMWSGLVILNRKRSEKLSAAAAEGEEIMDRQELGDANPHFKFTY